MMLQVTAVPEAALAAIAAQLLPGLLHLHKKSHMVWSAPQSLMSISCMSVCRQPCTNAQTVYARLSAEMPSCYKFCLECVLFLHDKASYAG